MESYTYDEGVGNEIILNQDYIGFETEVGMLNILDRDDRLKITLGNTARYVPYEDIDYKIDVRSLILKYPETDYCIREIGAVKSEIDSEKLLCGGVEINIYSKNYVRQSIFIHSK